MAFYGLGNILFPNVDMTYLKEMYSHCAAEDPDINAADFVLEHLLNIPDVFESLEQNEQGEQEKPHQPIHIVYAASVAVVLAKPIVFECRNTLFNDGAIVYGAFRGGYFPSGSVAKMLRPPII